jgi:hypothetical protein
LNHGYNFEGDLCGVDAAVKDLPYVFYCGSKEPRGDGSMYPEKLYFRAKTCVKTCPTDDKMEGIGCLRPETFQFHEADGKGVAQTNAVNYQLTYEIEVHQTVEIGKSYPTNAVGSYCIPADETLKLDLLNGPLAQPKLKWDRTMKSVIAAGPIILGAAILALIFGTIYLYLLSYCAGPVMFFSLVLATISTAIVGVFFVIAIFFNPEDYLNDYCALNPIVHSIQSSTGTIYSVFFGLLLLAFAACLGISTKNAMPKIDESIGIISAAIECVFSSYEMKTFPLQFALVMLFEFVVFAVGLSILSTVGYVDHTSISMNSDYITGLEARFVWYWGWELAIVFWCFMCLWIFEITVASFQFSVAYATCQWYWVVPEYVEGTQSSKKMNATPKYTNATVSGVDSMGGQRKGIRVKGAGGAEVVVFPVGKRGPGNRDVLAGMNLNDIVLTGDKVEKKEMPAMALSSGVCKSLTYHLGTLAMGALVIPLCRPFRLIAMGIRATMGRADKRTSYDDEDTTPQGAMMQLAQLMAGLIENICGGLSKNAFVDVVLSTNTWKESSLQAKWMVEDAGGVVAFMHGSCGVYELIGVVLITTFCTLIANICLQYIPLMTDPTSDWYVEDSWDVTVFCVMPLCGVISYAFMAQFNIVIDGLLYSFAWARRMKIKENSLVLPRAIKGILEKELEGDPDSMGVLEPQGNRMNPFGGAHFGHAVSKLTSTALGTRVENRPLLSTNPNHGQPWA